MLSWWHDGQATFHHTSQPFYILMKWDIPSSQHLLYCRLFQKNLPANQRSAAQGFGSTNIERLVSMSVLQSQLAMQEVVKPHEDDSTSLQKCFKQIPGLNLCHNFPSLPWRSGGMKTRSTGQCACLYLRWLRRTVEIYEGLCMFVIYFTNVRRYSESCRSNWLKYQPNKTCRPRPLATPSSNFFARQCTKSWNFLNNSLLGRNWAQRKYVVRGANGRDQMFTKRVYICDYGICRASGLLINGHICFYTPQYVDTSNHRSKIYICTCTYALRITLNLYTHTTSASKKVLQIIPFYQNCFEVRFHPATLHFRLGIPSIERCLWENNALGEHNRVGIQPFWWHDRNTPNERSCLFIFVGNFVQYRIQEPHLRSIVSACTDNEICKHFTTYIIVW